MQKELCRGNGVAAVCVLSPRELALQIAMRSSEDDLFHLLVPRFLQLMNGDENMIFWCLLLGPLWLSICISFPSICTENSVFLNGLILNFV